MKWVLIEQRHINMNNVDLFSWDDGILCIYYSGDPNPTEVMDPDRKLYLKMCRSQGVTPYEEDDNGQNVTD